MRNERKRYTEEFKREAVRLMESSEKLIAEIARDLGINDNNLYRWRGQYGPQSVGKAMGSNRNIGEMEAESKRLRREVEVLRHERDVLKRLCTFSAGAQYELQHHTEEPSRGIGGNIMWCVGSIGERLLRVVRS